MDVRSNVGAGGAHTFVGDADGITHFDDRFHDDDRRSGWHTTTTAGVLGARGAQRSPQARA